jgi:hypothetical protein
MSGQGYWWIALGLGLVVAVVVVVLLQVFLNEVHRIERGAATVWQAGKQVAGNTASTWLLADTSARLAEIIDEAGRHGRLLRGEPDHHAPAPVTSMDRSTTASPTAGGAR